MKNVLFIIASALLVSATVSAQNFSKVEKAAKDSNWNEAYNQLTILKQNDKKQKLSNNAEYEYWQGYVISNAGMANKEISALPDVSTYIQKGFEHLQKAYQLNKALTNFYASLASPYKAFWDIYAHCYQNGVNAYNEEKNYEKAALLYNDAAMAGAFLAKENLGLPPLDTNLVFLKALNYIQLKDAKNAFPYIEQTLLTHVRKSEGLDMLKWEANKLMEDKNDSLFYASIDLGKQYYPEHKDDVWNQFVVEYKLSASGKGESKLAEYEKMIFTDKTADSRLKYNYVVELYGFLNDNNELSDDKKQEYLEKMRSASMDVFDEHPDMYQPIYLYQVYLFKYCEKINTTKSSITNELRVKAAPVKGIAPKGSKLEKELNALKAKIKKRETDLKTWAQKGLEPSDKLIAYLDTLAASNKTFKNQLSSILDVAAGFAYFAGDNAKSDAYDKKRESLTKSN